MTKPETPQGSRSQSSSRRRRTPAKYSETRPNSSSRNSDSSSSSMNGVYLARTFRGGSISTPVTLPPTSETASEPIGDGIAKRTASGTPADLAAAARIVAWSTPSGMAGQSNTAGERCQEVPAEAGRFNRGAAAG
jgi:hypothetical protein